MRREDIILIAFWAAVIAIAFIGFYQLGPLVQATAPVVAAFISAAALIFGGILTHYLSEIRAQRLADQTRRQENYKEILQKLSTLVRERKADDLFRSLHLQTCVVGSAKVIKSSEDILKRVNQKTNLEETNLSALLTAMRDDLGLPKADITATLIFPKRDEGYIGDNSAAAAARSSP